MSKRIDYTATGKRMEEQREPQALMKRELVEMQGYLDGKVGQLERWITGGVDPRALVRFAMLDMSTNDKLRSCSRESIYMALLACAVTGLEPGALKGEAFLVPFKGVATFMVGWRGIVKQARRSREVVGIHSNVVFDGDTFELDLGSGAPPVHKPLLRGPRGPIIGAYAVARMTSGISEVEWMDIEDLNAVKAVALARGASPAWKDWEDQMFRKAPIRRLGKRLPLGHDYHVGEALERAADDGRKPSEVLDVMTDGEATRAEAAGAVAASMRAQAEPARDGDVTDDEAAEIARLEREA